MKSPDILDPFYLGAKKTENNECDLVMRILDWGQSGRIHYCKDYEIVLDEVLCLTLITQRIHSE